MVSTEAFPEIWIYGAYGYRVATTVHMARTGYCGEVREADIPWYLLGTRFYVPWLRRLLSPDPLSPFNAGGFNRYAYCAGDPVNRIDPSGNAWWDWLGVALGVVAAVFANAVTMGIVTPVTTLAMVGIMADIVSVAVEVGAVVAMERNDDTLGGILGWVGFGVGMASAGLGVAGQAIGKGEQAASQGARGARHEWRRMNDISLANDLAFDGPRSPRGNTTKQYNLVFSNRILKQNQGKGLKTLPELQDRSRIQKAGGYGNFRIVPGTKEWQNGKGGFVIGFDSRTTPGHVSDLARAKAAEFPNRQIRVFTGGHGSPNGKNWGSTENGRQWLHREGAAVDAAEYNLLDVGNAEVVDIATMNSKQFKAALTEDDAVNILGMCYSIADSKANSVFLATQEIFPVWNLYIGPAARRI